MDTRSATAQDIAQWNWCHKLARDYGISIVVKAGFEMYDDNEKYLGEFHSVSEVYSFLCGYAYRK